MFKSILVRQFSLITLLLLPLIFSLGFWTGRNVDNNPEQPFKSGESLMIEFPSEPTLEMLVHVNPDQTMMIPLVGEIRPVGLTPSEITSLLRKKFGKLVKTTDVKVIRLNEKITSLYSASDLR